MKRIFLGLVFFAVCSVCVLSSAQAAILRQQNDQNALDTGFSLSGLNRLAAEFEAILSEGDTPGAQLAVYKNEKFIIYLAGGTTENGGSTPVGFTTLFQYRSVTKALAAISDMILWDASHFQVNDLVTRYWPGYGSNGKQDTTLGMLLAHRAGIPQSLSLGAGQFEMNPANRPNIVSQIETLAPLWTPGAKNGYDASNAAYVMDELALRAEGRDTAQIFLEDVLAVSGIADLWIGLPASEFSRMAQMYVHWWVRLGQPERASFSDYLNTQPGIGERISWVTGCGTAKALAEIGQILAGKGTYKGVTYYSEAAHTLFSTPTNAAEVVDAILGYVVRWGLVFILGDTPVVFGDASHSRAVGHLGGSATVLEADPDTGLSYAYVTNSMLPDDQANERYRRIGNAVWNSLAGSSGDPPDSGSDSNGGGGGGTCFLGTLFSRLEPRRN